MDKVQKLSNSECYTPSSEPFTVTDTILIWYLKFAWPHVMDTSMGIEESTKIFVLSLFATRFHAGFLLALYLNPEDGSFLFLLNFC
jgi:hypothetical protein